MSEKYIVRQPIKDCDNKVIGYEILYHGENTGYDNSELESTANESATADTVYNFLLQNTNKALKGSLNFMTFTPTLLMKKTPQLFDQEELVIQIDDNVIIHPTALNLVQNYGRSGYKIAVNEFQFSPRYLGLLDSIDYIKINFQNLPDNTLHNIIEIAHSMKKQCLAVGLDTEELYQKAIQMNVDYLEGSFVAQKMATKAHASGYLQGNFFRLMVAITKEEPDLDEIVQLISLDATLTFGLLRMVNSRFFALRHKATSVHQAIMTMGLSQLKQWIYLLSASNSENEFDNSAEEFLKLSLMRASFCGALTKYAYLSISQSDAYLMGMLSTLNHLVDAPLEDILSSIPISDEIKEALLRREGKPGLLFELTLAYERADWDRISLLAEELKIPTNLLISVYFNCAEDVNTIWRQLTSAAQNQVEESDAQITASAQSE